MKIARDLSLSRGLVGLACALAFLLCCAWGATGHKVVAQIASGHLTPKAKVEVDRLLAGSTLAEFRVWSDQIKSDPAWKWTKPWHFGDMPQGAIECKMCRHRTWSATDAPFLPGDFVR